MGDLHRGQVRFHFWSHSSTQSGWKTVRVCMGERETVLLELQALTLVARSYAFLVIMTAGKHSNSRP